MTYLARYWAWLKAEKLLPILIGIFLLRLLLTPIGIFTQDQIGEFNNDWRIIPQHIANNPVTQVTEAWVSWDSNWYNRIADKGYLSTGEPFSDPKNQDIAFFPAYPTAIRALHTLGIPIQLAGLIISSVSTVLIVTFGYLLLRARKIKDSTARLALIFLFAHPIAYIFGAMFSEGLFLALALMALYAWQTKSYGIFWAVGILAGLSRPVGPLLCIPGFVLMVQQKFWSTPIQQWAKKALALTGPLIGVGTFIVYVHSRAGLWDAFSRAEAEVWGRHQSLLNIFTNLFTKPFSGINWLIFAGFAWTVIIMVLIYRKKIGLDLTIWSLVMLVGPLLTIMVGMPRYTITIFPLAMAFAFLTEHRPRLRNAMITAMLIAQLGSYILWVMNAQILQ